MGTPSFLRPLAPDEHQALKAGLRSPDSFTLRRCQILLSSDEGLRPSLIAARLGCASQTVRNAIRAFDAEGPACRSQKSNRPNSFRPELDVARGERLRALLRRSPRDFGKPTSLWTLASAAEVAFAEGLTARPVSDETIRRALIRLAVGCKRAKTWITSPDPAYLRKKGRTDRLIRLAASHPDWVLGFQDEVWWSRLARPTLHAWAGGEPKRLHDPAAADAGTEAKALACYGLLRGDTGAMMLRFVLGRPVSQVTEEFLAWACQRLSKVGKRALLLVRDIASWHISQRVRSWINGHNRRAKAEDGVRIVSCPLPVKAPWLNRIEPKWVHGKRAIVEPDRPLTASEVIERVCGYFGREQLDRIAQQVT